MRHRRVISILAVTSLVAACSGAVDPAGEGARRIADLWWMMFWVGLIPLFIVLVILVMSALGMPRARLLSDRTMIVGGGVVLSIVLLIPVVVVTLMVERDLQRDRGEGLVIEVTGHQWWWDVEYPHPSGEGMVRTANEIHIPVGESVTLRVTSNDVIHSIWIPEIHGKIDMIPGHVNELVVLAEKTGAYQGRCAEFCGLSHAVMRLIVVASEPEEFEEWLLNQAEPVAIDVDPTTRRVFANSCAPCHTVRGMFEMREAFEGDFGPDLTHLASRRMIGANLLPNTNQALARWIVDPQGVKPGNRMPDVGLSAGDLDRILELLGELR